MKHEELTGQIIGAAMAVLNDLKPGLDEKLYENALVIELASQGHTAEQQRNYPVQYRGHLIGKLVPDFIVDGKWDNAVTNSMGFIPSSNGWGIGARYNGTWSYQGFIEDVRIYDRALKEDEIKQIYAGRD